MNGRNDRTQGVLRWLVTHHVPASIWLLGALVIGAMGFFSMTRESLPDLPIPQALITVEWAGASPEAVEEEIVRPLEEQLRGIIGLKSYSSGAMHSFAAVAIQFREGIALDEAMQRLRSKVADAETRFPKKAEKPQVEQVQVRDIPVGFFALRGEDNELNLLQKARELKRSLQRIPGVRKVRLEGLPEESLRVELIPERLESLNIAAYNVFQKLQNRKHDLPLGTFDHPRQGFSLIMGEKLNDLHDLRSMPLFHGENSQAALLLGDVARVRRAAQKSVVYASLSVAGKPFASTAILSILKVPGGDSSAIMKQARALFVREEAEGSLGKGVTWTLLANDAEYIDEEMKRTWGNLWQSMLIVFCCLMLLLAWREALVAALGIPLTLIASMGALWLAGYTMNTLVMAGCILALGILVDDFILVMEGMHHFMLTEKLPFHQAAWRTLTTYGIPSFSGSITTILVMLPLACIRGIDGAFVRVVPVTAAICLIASYLLSLFVGLPLSQLAFRGRKKEHETTVSLSDRITHKAETHLFTFLRRTLLPTPARRAAFLGLMALFFVSAAGLFLAGPSTLYPQEDGKSIGITLELAEETVLEETVRVAARAGELLRKKPYFASIISLAGNRDPVISGTLGGMLIENTSPRYVGFFCRLTPRKEREKEGFRYAEDLRRELETLLRNEPGLRVMVTPEDGGSSGEAPIQIALYGDDMDVLNSLVRQVRRQIALQPGIRSLRDSMGYPREQRRFVPQRDRLERYGIESHLVGLEVQLRTDSVKVGDFRAPNAGESIPIYCSTLWEGERASSVGPVTWEQLRDMRLHGLSEKAVLLSDLGTFEPHKSYNSILHKEGERCAIIRARLEGTTSGAFWKRFLPELKTLRQGWPQGYSYKLGGEQEQAGETYNGVLKALAAAFLLVYAVLALLFRSLLQPFIILGAIVPGISGVFWGFRILGMPFSFTAAIGIISLVGITVNDAIVMVDTMNRHRQQGRSLTTSAFRGAAERLRPVISTTLTTVLALIPLLGEAAWKPLAATIILGESISTPLCLGLIPALYIALSPHKTTKN